MSVIDEVMPVTRWWPVITADDIIRALIEQLDAKAIRAKDVAAALGIAPARVTEMRQGARRVQQHEMEPLASYLGLTADAREATTTNATVVAMEGASLEDAPENLPVWGTGLGAEREVEGNAIEQTLLNTGEIIEYVARPAILKRKGFAYALYVQGSSMHPALPDGEMAVACKDMPMSSGDNVVVYLRTENPEDDDGLTARAVLVKELVRRSARYVELRQYQPYLEFRIDMARVLRIDRILSRREMIATQ